MWRSAFLFLAIASQCHSAPQFITFKDGKLGVNFGGYHAGVGLGGILGGGAGGGLFAEAGTPHGQAAKAGLGGVVNQNGGTSGGLYAGATAGGNVRAETGLAGGVGAEKSAGGGFASASAGGHHASSGLGGEAAAEGSSGFKYSGKKYVKESEVAVVPIEHKPVNDGHKVHSEFNFEAANEINAVPLTPVDQINTQVDFKAEAHNDEDKEIHIQSPLVIEKHIVHTHYKPHKHHTAYVGGFLGGEIHPQTIQKRIDVGTEGGVAAEAGIQGGIQGGHTKDVTYTKEVAINRNPTFFQDIFNIPISTLKAVGSFLSNTATGTNVSVQKSATIQTDSVSPKHASSASLSQAHVSVETPSASKFIDDIFAIPINTLGAVNKFLENNVPAKKKVLISQVSGEPTPVRLGPHARRRANRRVVVIENPEEKAE